MHKIKKTKIVCTIGPATETESTITKLITAGMNVARFNFSHGTREEHQTRMDVVRGVAKRLGVPFAILQDLSGPKIRVGTFEQGGATLEAGATFTLTTDDILGSNTRVSVNYQPLSREVNVGDPILLCDGKIRLEVAHIEKNDIVCRVVVGGKLKDRNGVNLPKSELSIGALTEKDKTDLKFGIENDVEFVALSFVRKPEDVDELRTILDRAKSKARIIAKIETPQAVKNIDEIIKRADGIMVARGDLAIEIPAEEVPLAQKMIIRKCNEFGKPVITATQMLESMIASPVPTRAEVSDVANAILDGTDAIMLSEETALGKYPVEAVEMMTRIARNIEQTGEQHRLTVHDRAMCDSMNCISDALGNGAIAVAKTCGAKAIVALTDSGFSARMIARYKPEQKIVALTPDAKTRNQLSLSYGCIPFLVDKNFKRTGDAVEKVRNVLIKEEIAQRGDRVVVVFGIPFNTPGGGTNSLVAEVL